MNKAIQLDQKPMFSMTIPKLECSKSKPQNETKWSNLTPITYHGKALNML